MSLETPDAIRTLQRKLYVKAKAEPGFRFYILYDKVWRTDILAHAYDLARANKGAPGVDGVTFDRIEAAGVEDWLTGLGQELRTKTYRCQPVRRVMIPKAGGGERPLGIPTIRDRVVQTAVKLVVEPIFEADLDPAAHGYRPGRGAGQAIQTVLTLLRQGYTDVVDADLSQYFDTIPHDELMQSLARRIVDPDMLRLIKQWLKAPVETTDGDGGKHMEGGKASRQGVPLGGVISPLVANLYMNRFLKHWRQSGRGEAWQAHVINYADDFVILSRGHAAEALAWTDRTMARLGLTLNRTKTRLCGCTDGPVRLSGLQLRSGSHPTGRTPLHRRQSLGQKRAETEGQGGRYPGSRQHGTMGGCVCATDPPDAGLGRLLQSRVALRHGPGDRSAHL